MPANIMDNHDTVDFDVDVCNLVLTQIFGKCKKRISKSQSNSTVPGTNKSNHQWPKNQWGPEGKNVFSNPLTYALEGPKNEKNLIFFGNKAYSFQIHVKLNHQDNWAFSLLFWPTPDASKRPNLPFLDKTPLIITTMFNFPQIYQLELFYFDNHAKR